MRSDRYGNGWGYDEDMDLLYDFNIDPLRGDGGCCGMDSEGDGADAEGGDGWGDGIHSDGGDGKQQAEDVGDGPVPMWWR